MAIKNTMVKMGISRTNQNVINIEITDAHSGDNITRVEMSLEDYALLVSGLHGVNGKAIVNSQANIACSRKTERVYCDDVDMDEAAQGKEVLRHFKENYEKDGWKIQSDGLGTQQKTPGKHQYIIKRYLPVKNPMTVERSY